MFGLSNFIITEFLLIFYSLVTNVLYSYIIPLKVYRNRTIWGPHTLVQALLKITEPSSSLQSELSRSLLGSVIFMAVLM